jgi:hypothetical protein
MMFTTENLLSAVLNTCLIKQSYPALHATTHQLSTGGSCVVVGRVCLLLGGPIMLIITLHQNPLNFFAFSSSASLT